MDNLPRLLACHPIGNTFAKEAAVAFCEKGLLEEFHVSLATTELNIWGTLARIPGFSELHRRRYPECLNPFLRLQPRAEILRLLASRFGLHFLVRHETGAFSVDAIFRKIDQGIVRRIRQSPPDIFYAYEDGAYFSFPACKEVGTRCVYDLPIGYWRAARRIQAEECERRPEWADTMPALIDSDGKVARKDRELELADQVIVASQFTANTLKEAPFPSPPISIVPYGCPPPFQSSLEEVRKESNPLRVIFVGSLSQRKGLADLLEAVERMGSSVELTLIGREVGECSLRSAALKKHRWFPSLSHNRVLAEMRRQDVLVFPSLFEGFGMVVTEALSQGIPVITTPNTCGPDLLTEGEDGFVVPIRSPEAIIEKLDLLRRDRTRLAHMKTVALTTAKKKSWAGYREDLCQAILDGVRS